MQSILIVDCNYIYKWMEPELLRLATQHSLLYHDFETMYDWMLTHAMSRVLTATVRGHVLGYMHDDLLAVIYSEIGLQLESLLHQYVRQQGIEFLKGETIKMLVTYKDVIIVRTR